MASLSEAQSAAVEEAAAISKEAARRYRDGAVASAIALTEQALATFEQVFGPDHPDLVTSLANLGGLYRLQGAYARAESFLERALRIRERAFGVEHLLVASSLADLGELHQAQLAYARAEPLLRRALQIRERLLGAKHLDVASSLSDLASLHHAQARYAEAEPLLERALIIYEDVLGVEHVQVAALLNHLALVLHEGQGAHTRAVALLERALHINERVHGSEHADIATVLHNLGGVRVAQGRYLDAEPLYQRALQMQERLLGGEHPQVASSLNGLAVLYEEQGAYARAEPLFQRALAIRKQQLGANHPGVAALLDNLGRLHFLQGAYAHAEPLFQRALAIREQQLGAEHPEVAAALHNLARIHVARDEHARAEPLYLRALEICERTLGSDHPDLVALLNNLGALYVARAEYARAEPLYLRALEICDCALGPDHPLMATSLTFLVGLHMRRGACIQAEPICQRVLDIYERVLGAEHPAVATSLRNLSVVSWTIGDLPRAVQHAQRAAVLHERHVAATLSALPEQRKRLMLRTQRSEIESLVSLHAHAAPDDPAALRLALTVILHNKGRVLAEVAGDQMALRRNLSPALQGELEVLLRRRAELTIGRRVADPRHTDAVEALEQEVERREAELSRKSEAFRAHAEPPTIEAIQAALPSDAVLVELLRYRRFDPANPAQYWQEARYIAYMLEPRGPARWVALGEAEPIEAAIAEAQPALVRAERDVREPLRALDDLLLAPIRRQIGSSSHLLLSPDAALHLVPFAALVDEDGRYAVERMRITYVTSGRSLVRAAAPERARSRPLVVAAPDYRGRCTPLPGAAAEALAVHKHFRDAELHVGPHATKQWLVAAHGPLFVHVATHGFFRTPRASSTCAVARAWRDDRDVTAELALTQPPDDPDDVEDALDNASLIFAGVDDADAYLTAREIAAIDLHDTRLVVLSACDTGIGQMAWSEGVYGLRRALAIAGAQTQVVSLWKIDDDATSQLMDDYYGALRGGAGRSDALRHAQQALLLSARYAHPFFWAAFVAIGDERPL